MFTVCAVCISLDVNNSGLLSLVCMCLLLTFCLLLRFCTVDVFPLQVCQVMPDVDAIQELVSVVCVLRGANGSRETIKQRMLKWDQFEVDLRKIIFYLKMYKIFNKSYADIEILESNALLQNKLEWARDQLCENAIEMHTSGNVTVDDVSQARSHQDGTVTVDEDDEVPVVSNSVLLHPLSDPTDGDRLVPNMVTAVKDLFVAQQKKTLKVEVARESLPINSYTDANVMFYQTFPHLFCLGQGLSDDQRMVVHRDSVIHLLHQFHQTFARCKELLFTIFNMRQRHAVNSAVCAKVKASPEDFQGFTELVTNQDFKSMLQKACDDPASEEARQLLGTVSRYVTFIGKSVPYSSSEVRYQRQTLYALTQRYGEPSIFLTISPDDVHSLKLVRTGLKPFQNYRLNQTPKYPSSFIQYAKGDEIAQIPIKSLKEVDLQAYAAENPVACASIFKDMMEAVFEVFLQTLPRHKSKTSFGSDTKLKGVFGKCRAAFCVTETQGRLALHTHWLIWTGLLPYVVEQLAEYGFFHELIANVFDSHIKCAIPAKYHAKQLVEEERFSFVPRPFFECEDMDKTMVKNHYKEKTYDIIRWTSMHVKHTPTCKKYRFGKIGCRLGKPSALRSVTQAVELGEIDVEKMQQDDAGSQRKYPRGHYIQEKLFITPRKDSMQGVNKDILRPGVKTITDIADRLISRDVRRICWEMARPPIERDDFQERDFQELEAHCSDLEDQADRAKHSRVVRRPALGRTKLSYDNLLPKLKNRNGLVTDYNETLTYCLKCNTAVLALGGTAQGQSAMHYTSKYITKTLNELASTALFHRHIRHAWLSFISKKSKEVAMYPSSAADSGSDVRTGKHIMQRIMNGLNSMNEYADTQVSAALLGMPSYMCSENVAICHIDQAVKFYQEEYQKAQQVDVISDGNDTDSECSSNSESESVWSETDQDDIDETEQCSQHRSSATKDRHIDRDMNDNTSFPDPMKRHKELNQFIRGQTNLGTGMVYTVQGKRVPVRQYQHYMYRGRKLEHLCYYEYTSIVAVVATRKTCQNKTCQKDNAAEHMDLSDEDEHMDLSDADDVLQGSSSCHIPQRRYHHGTFAFDKGHPLAKYPEWMQRLRAKHVTPSLGGHKPPKFPDDTASAKAADRIARYYLLLFRPWNHNDLCQADFSWETLKQYMSSLYYSESYISMSRLATMLCVARVSEGSRVDREMFTQYRNRCADLWANLANEQSIPSELQHDNDHSVLVEQLENMVDDMTWEDLSPQKKLRMARTYFLQQEHLSKRLSDFKHLLEVPGAPSMDLSDHQSHVQQDNDVDVHNFIKDISKIQGDNVTCQRCSDPSQHSQYEHDHSLLNQEQMSVVNTITKWVFENEQHRTPDGPLILLCGGPGTGKTFVIQMLNKYVPCVIAAPTGVAASNIRGAVTIHHLFFGGVLNINDRDTYLVDGTSNAAQLRHTREQLMKASVLVLDEVSMITAGMLGQIEHACRILRGKECAFGGMAVLLAGDFYQLPPTAAQPLYATLLEMSSQCPTYKQQSPQHRGAAIFSQFQAYFLHEQMRAKAADKKHLEMIEAFRCRNEAEFNTKYESVVENLMQKVITSADIAQDMSWKFATILVTSNAEKACYNYFQAKQFAIRQQVPFIKWKNPLNISVDHLSSEEQTRLYESHPALYGVFVKGAPCFLTQNINPSVGLANGTRGIMHSLIFGKSDPHDSVGSSHDDTVIQAQTSLIQGAAGGEEILLSIRPQSINVQVDIPEWKHPTLSVNPDIAVIPIVDKQKGTKRKGNSRYNSVSSRGGVLIEIDKSKFTEVETRQHGVDLGFAITYWKIQGMSESWSALL